MKEELSKVKEFHDAFKVTSSTTPSLIPEQDYILRFKLMQEENEEYLEAAEKADLVEIADALGDQLYILCGTILKHGLQNIITEVFKEIHSSNMSKLDEKGQPVINGENNVLDESKPLGKILKSNRYFKPNIKKFLN